MRQKKTLIMKSPVVSGTSHSCSCTSCFDNNASCKYNLLNRMINLGPGANSQHGKDLSTKERKLLDKLIAEYNKVKSELLSGINRSDELKADSKSRTYRKCDGQGTDDAERASAMLELFKLVDKSEALGHSDVSECCSCYICSLSKCSRSKRQCHRHCHTGRANYSSRSSVVSQQNRIRNGKDIRFKEKYVYSDPCTCTTKLSSVITNLSKEMSTLQQPVPLKTSCEEVCKIKKNKMPIKRCLQKIKHSELTMNNVLDGRIRGEVKKPNKIITVLVKESKSKLKGSFLKISDERLKKFKNKNKVGRTIFDYFEVAPENDKLEKRTSKQQKLSTKDRIAINTNVVANKDANTKVNFWKPTEKIIQVMQTSNKLIRKIDPETGSIPESGQESQTRVSKYFKTGFRKSSDKLSRHAKHRLEQARKRLYQNKTVAQNSQVFQIEKKTKMENVEALTEKNEIKNSSCLSEECIPQDCHEILLLRKARLEEMRRINQIYAKEKSLTTLSSQIRVIQNGMECKSSRSNGTVTLMKILSKPFLDMKLNQFKKSYAASIYTQPLKNFNIGIENKILSTHSVTSFESGSSTLAKNWVLATTDLRTRKSVKLDCMCLKPGEKKNNQSKTMQTKNQDIEFLRSSSWREHSIALSRIIDSKNASESLSLKNTNSHLSTKSLNSLSVLNLLKQNLVPNSYMPGCFCTNGQVQIEENYRNDCSSDINGCKFKKSVLRNLTIAKTNEFRMSDNTNRSVSFSSGQSLFMDKVQSQVHANNRYSTFNVNPFIEIQAVHQSQHVEHSNFEVEHNKKRLEPHKCNSHTSLPIECDPFKCLEIITRRTAQSKLQSKLSVRISTSDITKPNIVCPCECRKCLGSPVPEIQCQQSKPHEELKKPQLRCPEMNTRASKYNMSNETTFTATCRPKRSSPPGIHISSKAHPPSNPISIQNTESTFKMKVKDKDSHLQKQSSRNSASKSNSAVQGPLATTTLFIRRCFCKEKFKVNKDKQEPALNKVNGTKSFKERNAKLEKITFETGVSIPMSCLCQLSNSTLNTIIAKKTSTRSLKSSKITKAQHNQYPCDSEYPREPLCKQVSSKQAMKVNSNFSFRVELCKDQRLSSEKDLSADENTVSVDKEQIKRSLVVCAYKSSTEHASKAVSKKSKPIKCPSLKSECKYKKARRNIVSKKKNQSKHSTTKTICKTKKQVKCSPVEYEGKSQKLHETVNVNKDKNDITCPLVKSDYKLPKSHLSITVLTACKEKKPTTLTVDCKCKSNKPNKNTLVCKQKKQIKSGSVECESKVPVKIKCKPLKPHKITKVHTENKNVKHPPVKGETKSMKSNKSMADCKEKKQNRCHPVQCLCKPQVKCECNRQGSHKTKPVCKDNKVIRRKKNVISVSVKSQKSLQDKNCHSHADIKSSRCNNNGIFSFLKRWFITLRLKMKKHENECRKPCGMLSKTSLSSSKKKCASKGSFKQPKQLDQSSTAARKSLSKKSQATQHKIDKVYRKSRDHKKRPQHDGRRKLAKSSSVPKQQAGSLRASSISSQRQHQQKGAKCKRPYVNKTVSNKTKQHREKKKANNIRRHSKCQIRGTKTRSKCIRTFLKKICTFNLRRNKTPPKCTAKNLKNKKSTRASALKKAKASKKQRNSGSRGDTVSKKSTATLTSTGRSKATQYSKKQSNKAKCAQDECKSSVFAGKKKKCFCNTKSQVNCRTKSTGSNTRPMPKRCFCTSKSCRQTVSRTYYPNSQGVYNFETKATWNTCKMPLSKVMPCEYAPGFYAAIQRNHNVSLQKITTRNSNNRLYDQSPMINVKTVNKSSCLGKTLERRFCTLTIHDVPRKSPSPHRFITVGRVAIEEKSKNLHKHQPMIPLPEFDQRFMSNEIKTIFPYTPKKKYMSKTTLALNLADNYQIYQTNEKCTNHKRLHPHRKHVSLSSTQKRKYTGKRKLHENIQSKVKYNDDQIEAKVKQQSSSPALARFVNLCISLFSPQKKISPRIKPTRLPKFHEDCKDNLYETASIKIPCKTKNILEENMTCKRSKSDGQPKKVILVPTKNLKSFTDPKVNRMHHQDLEHRTQNYSRYQSGDGCECVFKVPSISKDYKYADIENNKKILSSYCKTPFDTENILSPYARNYFVGYAFKSRKEKKLCSRKLSTSRVRTNSRKSIRSVKKVKKNSKTKNMHCDSRCAGLKEKGILKNKAPINRNVKRKHRKSNSLSCCDMCCDMPSHTKQQKRGQVSKPKSKQKINKKGKHPRLASVNPCDSTCLVSLTHEGKIKKPKPQKIKKIPKFKKVCGNTCKHIKHEKSHLREGKKPAEICSTIIQNVTKYLSEKTKALIARSFHKHEVNPKPNPLFEIRLDSKDYRVLNREQTINSIVEWQKKEMEGQMSNAKYGENCKCCLCLQARGVKRTSRTRKRNDKSDIILGMPSITQNNLNECVCGSAVCAKERQKLVAQQEQEMKRRKSLQKPCVCGSKVCAREAEMVLKGNVKEKQDDKKPEKPKKKKEKKERKEKKKKKKKKKPKTDTKKKKIEEQKKKLDKEEEKRKQKLEKEKEKMKKKEKEKEKKPKIPKKTAKELFDERMKKIGDARRKKYEDWRKSREYKKNNKYEVSARHRHKYYVAKMNRIESHATAERSEPDMRLIVRSVGDLWDLGATCVQSAARHDYRKLLQPTPKNKKIKPQNYKTQQYVTRVTLRNVQRRLLLTKFFGFIGRLAGGSSLRRRRRTRSPQNWGCNMYMATLRKKRCLWVFQICPWFYPYCINIMAIWRNFAFFLLFLLGVCIWTPCLMCMEICKVCVCCNC